MPGREMARTSLRPKSLFRRSERFADDVRSSRGGGYAFQFAERSERPRAFLTRRGAAPVCGGLVPRKWGLRRPDPCLAGVSCRGGRNLAYNAGLERRK
ncbi:hypothetical protein MRX96_017173 [Rhipicephalus microplus]